MSSQSLFIDNIAFAKRGEHLTGTLTVTDCPRLSALLKSQAPDVGDAAKSVNVPQGNDLIHYTLAGEVNAMGQHFLHLSLDLSLTTFCQRCLEQMPLDLKLNFNYLISEAGAEELDLIEAENDDDFDVQETCQSMDVSALIEDEIIMALPIAPMHENDCGKLPMQSGEKPNPFAALKALIKS